MNISETHNNKINFSAIKIASLTNTARNINTTIDMYALTSKDTEFIKNFSKTVSFDKLVPNLPQRLQNRWQDVFNYVTDGFLNSHYNSIIAISNNKIVGLISYYIKNSTLFLDGISKIPQEDNKIKLIGQNLIYNIFKIAQKERINKISLDAVTDGPYDVIKWYSKFGFKKEQDLKYIAEKLRGKEVVKTYQPMTTNKYSIDSQIKHLSEEIEYSEVPKSEFEDISLYKTIN